MLKSKNVKKNYTNNARYQKLKLRLWLCWKSRNYLVLNLVSQMHHKSEKCNELGQTHFKLNFKERKFYISQKKFRLHITTSEILTNLFLANSFMNRLSIYMNANIIETQKVHLYVLQRFRVFFRPSDLMHSYGQLLYCFFSVSLIS